MVLFCFTYHNLPFTEEINIIITTFQGIQSSLCRLPVKPTPSIFSRSCVNTLIIFDLPTGTMIQSVSLLNKKVLFPTYSKKTWFNNLKLSRTSTIQFYRLRVGHSYKLSLNYSQICAKYPEEMTCAGELLHTICICPFVSSNLSLLIIFLNSRNYPFQNSYSEVFIIQTILSFII